MYTILIPNQAKARNFPVTSIGSLLDEPFTGVVYLKSSGITEDFRSLKGKRIGYVGEFGKVITSPPTKHQHQHPTNPSSPRSKSTNLQSTTA
jgi:pyrimidine precursor biosynthesis enzyme